MVTKQDFMYYIADKYNEKLAVQLADDDIMYQWIMKELDRLSFVIGTINECIREEMSR